MKKTGNLFSEWLDTLSEYFAHRKGLLPLLGTLLVIVNLFLEIVFPGTFFTNTDILLHLGVIVAVFGLVLARAL